MEKWKEIGAGIVRGIFASGAVVAIAGTLQFNVEHPMIMALAVWIFGIYVFGFYVPKSNKEIARSMGWEE